ACRPGAGARPGRTGGAGHPRRAPRPRRPLRPPPRHAVPRAVRDMTAGRTPPAWWYDPARKPPLAARLLSSVYGGVVGARSALYARGWLKSHQAGVPVVIVGNLVVGGSGKTPLVIALVERLQAEGRKP